jgi:hypothetical protein
MLFPGECHHHAHRTRSLGVWQIIRVWFRHTVLSRSVSTSPIKTQGTLRKPGRSRRFCQPKIFLTTSTSTVLPCAVVTESERVASTTAFPALPSVGTGTFMVLRPWSVSWPLQVSRMWMGPPLM